MVHWISVSSLLAIASIHELPSRSIEFLLAFTQADIDVGVLMSRMGAKVKLVTFWTQSRNWRLVWSSKYWSIKKGLSPISSWPLCILHKRLGYFNLCLGLFNSPTWTRDNNFVGKITQEWSCKLCVDRRKNIYQNILELISRYIHMVYLNYLNHTWWKK